MPWLDKIEKKTDLRNKFILTEMKEKFMSAYIEEKKDLHCFYYDIYEHPRQVM